MPPRQLVARQLTLDLEASREAADAAVDAAGARADHAWTLIARQALANLARRKGRLPPGDARRRFLVDELWAVLDSVGAKRPDEGRAIAAILRWGVAQKLIEPTGAWAPSAQVKCHHNPRQIWKSVVEV